jgi:hypothetical protein
MCDAFKDIFMIPPVGEAVAAYLKEFDPRLQGSAQLVDVKQFCSKVESLSKVSSCFPRHLPRQRNKINVNRA